jgi:integrase
LWIALQTSARKGAIMDLTWDRVHFDVGVIHFEVPGRKQTKKRRASVAISDALRPVLERAFAERENDLVLGNKSEIWRALQLVAIEAGYKASRPRSTRFGKPRAVGISPNVLRHTAGTLMARAAVPLWHVGKVMGNSHLMVDRVYAKWTVGDTRAAVNAITPKRAAPQLEQQNERPTAPSVEVDEEDDG